MGARIAAARRAQNLTQQQVADRIQVTKSTISRYENGEIRRPKFPVLTAIAEVLGVSPIWILKGENLPSASLGEPPEELPVVGGPEGPFPAIGRLFAVRIAEDNMRISRAQTGDFLIVRRNSAPARDALCLLNCSGSFSVGSAEDGVPLGEVIGCYLPL